MCQEKEKRDQTRALAIYESKEQTPAQRKGRKPVEVRLNEALGENKRLESVSPLTPPIM